MRCRRSESPSSVVGGNESLGLRGRIDLIGRRLDGVRGTGLHLAKVFHRRRALGQPGPGRSRRFEEGVVGQKVRVRVGRALTRDHPDPGPRIAPGRNVLDPRGLQAQGAHFSVLDEDLGQLSTPTERLGKNTLDQLFFEHERQDKPARENPIRLCPRAAKLYSGDNSQGLR